MAQKLKCRIEQIVDHGEHVYTVALRPERQVPRFRAGQFLHLALDPYDPTGFWPESRVFSIASSPAERDLVRITYAVHGRFTARMEGELSAGGEIWIKMPYGDFVIDGRSEIALLAGGTGISAFTAFLEGLTAETAQPVLLAYGARTARLLIYRDVVERCASRVRSLEVSYFVEDLADRAAGQAPPGATAGRVSVDATLARLRRPFETSFYISGPPAMLRSLGQDLRARNISPEAIHIDAWE
jgi:ferredoxin-NADP reductase